MEKFRNNRFKKLHFAKIYIRGASRKLRFAKKSVTSDKSNFLAYATQSSPRNLYRLRTPPPSQPLTALPVSGYRRKPQTLIMRRTSNQATRNHNYMQHHNREANSFPASHKIPNILLRPPKAITQAQTSQTQSPTWVTTLQLRRTMGQVNNKSVRVYDEAILPKVPSLQAPVGNEKNHTAKQHSRARLKIYIRCFQNTSIHAKHSVSFGVTHAT
jgi:hypothetical protein